MLVTVSNINIIITNLDLSYLKKHVKHIFTVYSYKDCSAYPFPLVAKKKHISPNVSLKKVNLHEINSVYETHKIVLKFKVSITKNFFSLHKFNTKHLNPI